MSQAKSTDPDSTWLGRILLLLELLLLLLVAADPGAAGAGADATGTGGAGVVGAAGASAVPTSQTVWLNTPRPTQHYSPFKLDKLTSS